MTDTSSNICRIHIQGTVHERWLKWFGSLAMEYLEDGDTILWGPVQDQSQFIGILNQIHNLNLRIRSVDCGLISGDRKRDEEK